MAVKKSEILLDTVRRLSRRGAHASIRRILLKSHPSEVAGVVRQLPDEDAVSLMAEIRQSDVEAKAYSELGGSFLATCLAQRPDDKAHFAEVLQKLPEDEAAALLSGLDENLSKELMGLMHVGTQAEVTEILEHDEGTCGRIMAVNVFSLHQNLTAREAIDAIQKTSTPESLFYIYVVDDYENLVGVVSLRQILQGERTRRLADFMTREVIRVTAYQSQEEAARRIEEYNFVCLPVVNDEGKLVGMVTVDDIIDYIRDEAQDDVLQMAGVEKEAIEDFSFFRAFSSRGFWYLLLFVGGVLCSELVLRFFPALKDGVRFLAFAPLVLRMGGSIATQTSTFMHQGVLNSDIERGRALRALWGQNAVTLIVAALLAVVALLYSCLRFADAAWDSAGLSLGILAVAALSLMLGMAVPFVAHRLKLDSLKVGSRFFHFAMDAISLLAFFCFVRHWHLNA